MKNLDLSGTLDFEGMLDLSGESGGKVTINGVEVLVENAYGDGPPFLFPPVPPAAKYIDEGTKAEVICSLNKTVKAGGKAIVTQGIALQGNTPTWPGMVMRGAATVTVNQIPINIKNDQAQIFPSGGLAPLTQSGQ